MMHISDDFDDDFWKHKLIHAKESRSPSFNIPEGAAVATMVTGRGWMRAKVAALLNPNEDDDNNVHFYLCDLGQFVFFPSSSLHPLSGDLLLLLNWQKVIYKKEISNCKIFIIWIPWVWKELHLYLYTLCTTHVTLLRGEESFDNYEIRFIK